MEEIEFNLPETQDLKEKELPFKILSFVNTKEGNFDKGTDEGVSTFDYYMVIERNGDYGLVMMWDSDVWDLTDVNIYRVKFKE